jgi:hypothetical protein
MFSLNRSTMKHISYLFKLTCLFIITACGSGNDPIDYPIIYNFKTKEYEAAKYFLVDGANGLKEISAAGSFKLYDAEMKLTIEDFFSQDDNIKTVELLDDKKARITLFDGTTGEITYTKNGDILTLILDPDIQETIDLATVNLPDNKQQFKIPLSCYLHSFVKNGTKDYSPFSIDFAKKDLDLTTFAKNVAVSRNLKANDTIAVNLIQLVYE